MPRFIVEFFKTVVNDNGHAVEARQEVLEVDAPNADDAVKCGKGDFCKRRRLADWSLHADRVAATPAEFPS